MNKTLKKLLVWVFAVLITLFAAYYQRITGPTYPKNMKVLIDNRLYTFKLIRSADNEQDALLKLKISTEVKAKLFYRNFPCQASDKWEQADFNREGEELVANLPKQPAAGKLMYYIILNTQSQEYAVAKEDPVIIRFKGAVPAMVLIPHILFMFFAMFFANLAGLMVAFKIGKYIRFSWLTLILLTLGGMILGPIVQKYAFGELWTGIPFGWDLTDNKTLIAFIFWLIAVFGQMKKEKPYLSLIAAVVTLLVFSIPHSMFGSELNRASGAVTQGFIHILF